jgi:hypothetical protein
MNIARRTAAALFATAVGVGAATLPSAPALAANPAPDPSASPLVVPSSCTIATFCGYADNSYQTGEGYELIPEAAPGTCRTVSLRNTWTSVYNNTSRPVRLYLNTTCTSSTYWTVGAATGSSYLYLTFSPSANDSIDAIKYM